MNVSIIETSYEARASITINQKREDAIAKFTGTKDGCEAARKWIADKMEHPKFIKGETGANGFGAGDSEETDSFFLGGRPALPPIPFPDIEATKVAFFGRSAAPNSYAAAGQNT